MRQDLRAQDFLLPLVDVVDLLRGFVVFARGGFIEKQLAFGEPAGTKKTVELGGR